MIWLKLLIGLLPILYVSTNYGLFSDVRDLHLYQLATRGAASPDSKMDLGALLCIMLSFVIIVLLQLRIEQDNGIFEGDSGSCSCCQVCKWFRPNHVTNREESPYKPTTMRILFVVLSLIAGTIVFRFAAGPWVSRYTNIVLYILVACVCPWIFVLNHRGMRRIAKNGFKRQARMISLIQ